MTEAYEKKKKKRPNECKTPQEPDRDEEWYVRAQRRERCQAPDGRLIRRVHWDDWFPAKVEATGLSFDRTKMVRSIIDRMDAAGVVGYSWAIAFNGQLVDAGASGDARTPAETDPRAMTAETRMVSASLAKPLCGVAVMKLIEDGQISLTDPAYSLIEDTFPDAHVTVAQVNIRDLLTHRSGFNGPGALSQFEGTLGDPLQFLPGTNERYENWNYWFLAHVVEAVTGGSYVDYVTENILAPMGLGNVTPQVDDDAPCLYYANGSLSGGTTWNDFISTQLGAYGWFASAIDWARFLVHFRFDTVLSNASRSTMLNWPQTYFGFRHYRGQERGSYYGHGGDFTSGGREFHGGMMAFPDHIDAALLTNSAEEPDPQLVLIDAYHDGFD